MDITGDDIVPIKRELQLSIDDTTFAVCSGTRDKDVQVKFIPACGSSDSMLSNYNDPTTHAEEGNVWVSVT